MSKDWEKQFDEEFTPKLTKLMKGETQWGLCLEMVQFIKDLLKAERKNLLKEERKKDPMGVSQWKEYGKKWGYWEFFKKQERH